VREVVEIYGGGEWGGWIQKDIVEFCYGLEVLTCLEDAAVGITILVYFSVSFWK